MNVRDERCAGCPFRTGNDDVLLSDLPSSRGGVTDQIVLDCARQTARTQARHRPFACHRTDHLPEDEQVICRGAFDYHEERSRVSPTPSPDAMDTIPRKS